MHDYKIATLLNEKNECINQCIHIVEDMLNKLWKMKGTKAKIMSNNIFKIDSCRVPQEIDNSIIDE